MSRKRALTLTALLTGFMLGAVAAILYTVPAGHPSSTALVSATTESAASTQGAATRPPQDASSAAAAQAPAVAAAGAPATAVSPVQQARLERDANEGRRESRRGHREDDDD